MITVLQGLCYQRAQHVGTGHWHCLDVTRSEQQMCICAIIPDQWQRCHGEQVWDARKLKAPLAAFADLPAAPNSQCCFSPDESLIATGTANVPGAPSSGALVSAAPYSSMHETI